MGAGRPRIEPEPDQPQASRGRKRPTPGSPKDRMMVYVPRGVRVGVKHHAAEMKLSASDVIVEAVREYLTARGISIDAEPSVALAAAAVHHATADSNGVDVALSHQAKLIAELLLRFDEAVPRLALGGAGGKPAGTTVARGMSVLLAALKTAGEGGLNNKELWAAMVAGSISSSSTELAKAALRDAGIIRDIGRRWVLAAP